MEKEYITVTGYEESEIPEELKEFDEEFYDEELVDEFEDEEYIYHKGYDMYLTKDEYRLEGIFDYIMNLLLFIVYYLGAKAVIGVLLFGIHFEPIPGSTRQVSIGIFTAIFLLITSLYFCFTNNRRAKLLHATFNVFFAYTIYTSIVYFICFKTAFIIAFSLIGVLMAGSIIKIFSDWDMADSDTWDFKNRLIRWCITLRTVFSIVICALILILSLNVGDKLTNLQVYDIHVETKGEQKGYTIENSMDIISGLEVSVWKNLSHEEKIPIVRRIMDIEFAHLGVKNEIKLETKVIKDGIAGYYTDKKRTITIDSEVLAKTDIPFILRTIIHECRHAYQYKMVEIVKILGPEYSDLECIKGGKDFKWGFENYKAYPDKSYFENPTEIDAHAYADERVEAYLDKILKK